MKKIVIIEPCYTGTIHFPFNCGLLRIVSKAYPESQVIFVGGATQNDAIQARLQPPMAERCRFIDWTPYPDSDTSPWDVLRRIAHIGRAVFYDVLTADLTILSSATASCVAAIELLPRSKRQKLQIFLHGNLNEMAGWRSRNPVRRMNDLCASLRRAVKANASLIVLEEHILKNAERDFPWMAGAVFHFPHTRIPEEVLKVTKLLGNPINIGFAGNASIEKGFTQFLELARSMGKAAPGLFKFHAIGKRMSTTRAEDSAFLDTPPSATQLSRDEFLSRLDAMNFLFFWPIGEYYSNASSGVFYDAINRSIPLIASRKVGYLPTGENALGIMAASIEEVVYELTNLRSDRYSAFCSTLHQFGEKFDDNSLVNQYRQMTENSYNRELKAIAG